MPTETALARKKKIRDGQRLFEKKHLMLLTVSKR